MTSTTFTNYKGFGAEKHFVIVFAAPRKSGKTFLINKLLTEGKLGNQFDNIIIANPSLEFNDDYKIEGKVSAEVIKIKNNFYDKTTELIDQHKEANRMHFERPDTYEAIHSLLILDDVIDSKLAQYRSGENIADEIAERGRHYNMSVIISAQYLTGISPSLRRNAEYIFVFSPTNYTETERVLQEYVPQAVRKEFQEKMQTLFMERYSFLLLDNSPENRVYYKLRFRKGFSDHVFAMKRDEMSTPQLLGSKKKKQKQDDENEENP